MHDIAVLARVRDLGRFPRPYHGGEDLNVLAEPGVGCSLAGLGSVFIRKVSNPDLELV